MRYPTEFSRLTAEQYEAIGRAILKWSLVETTLEDILVGLAYAPRYLGRALTNDLGPDNRITALRNLCAIHAQQMGYSVVPEELVNTLKEIAVEIDTLKTERNQYAHYVWLRDNDTRVFGIRFRSKPSYRTGGPHTMKTIAEINSFSDRVEALAGRMEAALRKLPDLPMP